MNKSSHTDDTYKVPYESVDTHVARELPGSSVTVPFGRYKELNIMECIPCSDPRVPGIQGRCSVLQCVAACCIVLHRVAVGYPFSPQPFNAYSAILLVTLPLSSIAHHAVFTLGRNV